MRRKIKINFTDFYPGFEKTNNRIFNTLINSYDLIIDETKPDYLIYSCFGQDFLKYDCIRIFYTGENIIPDFNFCDYATGYAYLNFQDRYIRYPDFLFSADLKLAMERRTAGNVTLANKNRFCNFIYSNGDADPRRDKFYYLLSNYKSIDSAGKHLNNMLLPARKKSWSSDKIEFMRNYKFTIAFENSSLPGYTTEKILHSFISDSIPIYWGNPLVSLDFNPKSFINCHDFDSFDEVVNKIIEVDQNDELYCDMVNQPFFDKQQPDYIQDDFLLNFYVKIFEQPIETAYRRAKYGYNAFYEAKSKKFLNDVETYRNLPKGLKGLVRSFLNKVNW